MRQFNKTVSLNSEGVISGIDFLRNVSFEKMERLSGNVVVVGGGNVAVDVARTAARFGAEKVTMLCQEQKDEMPASEEEVLEAHEEGIELKCGYGPCLRKTRDLLCMHGKLW